MGRTELADDSVVLFTIDGSPVELVDLIETLRPASDDEWLDLLMRSANGLLEFPIASDDDPFVDIGNGNNWGANMSQQQFSLGTDRGGVWERFEHGQGPELVEYRSTDTAFLRVTTTFPNEARNIVVTQEGAEPQRARLVEIPGSGVLAAVIKLDPTLPYAVAWTDNDDEPVGGPVDAAASRAAANAGASP